MKLVNINIIGGSKTNLRALYTEISSTLYCDSSVFNLSNAGLTTSSSFNELYRWISITQTSGDIDLTLIERKSWKKGLHIFVPIIFFIKNYNTRKFIEWLKSLTFVFSATLLHPNNLDLSLIISPSKKEWPFMWKKNLNSFPQIMLCSKFSWNWLSGSEEVKIVLKFVLKVLKVLTAKKPH